jgi:hypothetical protein
MDWETGAFENREKLEIQENYGKIFKETYSSEK